MRSFGDLLAEHVAKRESQLVLGLDPDPAQLWPGVYPEPGSEPGLPGLPDSGLDLLEESRAQLAADAVHAHCLELIHAVEQACVAVKLQLARFEALGACGWVAMQSVADYAHSLGLLVIADAKRGDIDVSARAYANGLLGETGTPHGSLSGLEADLVTVNPLLGRDSVQPFVEVARSAGKGVLVLVRTSNPGAADIQDLLLVEGDRLWERLAAIADALGRDGIGESGLSDIGAVVGATAPGRLARARELMPHAVLLLPGVGAQGGRVEDLAPAFAPGRAGGLITASRSIAQAHLTDGGDPRAAARREAERLRELAWQLA
jgi:orotidine-5'-phosphate decarboxylase